MAGWIHHSVSEAAPWNTSGMVASLAAWESSGSYLSAGGRRIFYWERGAGRPLIGLHGFPASSFDWRRVADALTNRRFVALDFPGFGLSDKSSTGDYSIAAYADAVEALARELGIGDCDLVAHDMGDTVAAELLRRHNEGSLSFDVATCWLTNGSIFIDMAHLTSGQKLFLAMPARKMGFSPPLKLFRRQIRRLFGPEHQPDRDEIRMLEALLAHEGGARLVPLTIRYIEERRAKQDVWTAALTGFEGRLAALWGELDPIAMPAMVDRLVELRPSTEVVRWPDVGHWPSLEVPDRLAAELQRGDR